MTSPIYTFPDPRIEALAVLRAVKPGPTYGTLRLDDIPPDSTPVLPYVRVSVDSTSLMWPAQDTVTVRLAIWHSDALAGEALARELRARLLAWPGNARMRRPLPGTGPNGPVDDPDTGRPMSAFTITARLRPILLEENQ